MSQQIRILKGSYRGNEIVDQVFSVVKPVKVGAKGEFVTVDASETMGSEFDRIRIQLDAYELVDGESQSKKESDQEVIRRIQERFEILDEMTAGTINGDVRAMIVVGPPGVGKSFGVERQLEKGGLLDDIAGRRRRYEVVKGAMSAIGLYKKMYEFQDTGNVLVFDDCDSILFDDLSLNLLKAALDSSKKRTIHWNADSQSLRREGIENKFDFKGSIIFITNLKFDHVRSPKLKDHLAALMSRCHYLDLTLDTKRDKFLRIKQIASSGGLFREYGLLPEQEIELIDFIEKKQDQLHEVSLRMAIKLADLRRMSPDRWKTIAETTCMKR